MNVVRPAVQQEDRWPISRTSVDVPNVEDIGVDLRDLAERSCARLVDRSRGCHVLPFVNQV
jgi:hypothetical protein